VHQAAQAVAATNPGATNRAMSRCNQIVARAQMVPFRMVVHHELFEHVQQTPFAEEDKAVQALLAYRAHEPFAA